MEPTLARKRTRAVDKQSASLRPLSDSLRCILLLVSAFLIFDTDLLGREELMWFMLLVGIIFYDSIDCHSLCFSLENKRGFCLVFVS
ncbi:hypothetical protein LI328DRAFT_95729 [Trichoderma asperelloides]|nr:hypothetical protein LI328DRAFT_95729 [Trichoderma asperelloides]